jgi:monoamine oxidase
LVGQSNRDVSILSGNRYQLFNGELRKGDFFDNQWDELERALQDLKKDTDIASFLDEHFGSDEYEGLREKVKGFVEGFDAADMQRASALSLREEWKESDDEKQYHITGEEWREAFSFLTREGDPMVGG